MRGHGTAAAAHGNEGAVPALCLERAQTLESLGGRMPPGLLAATDVTGRPVLRAGEPRARIQGPVRPDRVGVAPVDLARSHVDPVGRGESAFPRLGAKERHLLVEEVTRVAHTRAG